jgi:hypothetical protein
MHLQSSLFTAVFLIALGFASKTELAGNLAKKNLTDIKPNLVNSADAIHELVRRDVQRGLTCVVIYNCPTAGSSISVYRVTAKLKSSQNGGGTLNFPHTRSSGLGLRVQPIPEETIYVFPETIPLGWTAQSEVNLPDGTVCLVTWTWSIKAEMDNPSTLTLSDVNSHQVKESCGKPCSSISHKACIVSPGTGCV